VVPLPPQVLAAPLASQVLLLLPWAPPVVRDTKALSAWLRPWAPLLPQGPPASTGAALALVKLGCDVVWVSSRASKTGGPGVVRSAAVFGSEAERVIVVGS